MGLSDAERAAVTALTTHFENAMIGLQLQNPDMPTVLPGTFAVCLGAAIYAAQSTQADGLTLPAPDATTSYGAYLEATQAHYAERLTQAATQQAEELLAGVDLALLEKAGAGQP